MQKQETSNKFGLDKQNLIMIMIGFAIVVLGFILMTGAPSQDTTYNPDIFSFRRIILGPGVSLAGFLFIIFGILYKKKDKE